MEEFPTKCVRLLDGSIVRVSNGKAETMVTSKEGTYCGKEDWKSLFRETVTIDYPFTDEKKEKIKKFKHRVVRSGEIIDPKSKGDKIKKVTGMYFILRK